MHAKKQKIYSAYVSKHTLNHEKQVILLTILNKKGWRYIAIKELSPLLREMKWKHHGDFHCLNCLHSFASEKASISEVKIKIFVTFNAFWRH